MSWTNAAFGDGSRRKSRSRGAMRISATAEVDKSPSDSASASAAVEVDGKEPVKFDRVRSARIILTEAT